MKALFIHPSWTGLYGKFREAARRAVLFPPLGVTYIAAGARALGVNVEILDGEVETLTEEKLKERLSSFNPDIVGITITTPMFMEAKRLVSLCRKYSPAKIILGGPHITILREKVFEDCPDADILVCGEGEETMRELFSAGSLSDNAIKHIPGVLLKNHDAGDFAERPFLDDLDSLPFPDRSRLKNEQYYWSIPHKGRLKFTTMLASRGCPFKCTFCSEPFLSKGIVRYRSPENVVSEIEEVTQKYGLNMLGFMDDTFTLKKDRIQAMCELIVKKNIKVYMDCCTHANCVDENVLTWMKKAGFLRVCFGIESGDELVLKATRKNVTLDRLKEAFRLARKAGLETCGFAIAGLPHDTKESVQKTIAFLRDMKDLDYGYVSIASPLPGTEMYDMAMEGKGGIKVFTSAYGTEYQRYDASMLEVNDLTSMDLSALQRRAFFSIYLTPRRIFYMLKRSHPRETLKNIFIFLRAVMRFPSFEFAKSFKTRFNRLLSPAVLPSPAGHEEEAQGETVISRT